MRQRFTRLEQTTWRHRHKVFGIAASYLHCVKLYYTKES